jgi:hypothetical protein
MRVLFIVGKKTFCGSLKSLKFCKLQFLTLPTQKVADPWHRLIISSPKRRLQYLPEDGDNKLQGVPGHDSDTSRSIKTMH